MIFTNYSDKNLNKIKYCLLTIEFMTDKAKEIESDGSKFFSIFNDEGLKKREIERFTEIKKDNLILNDNIRDVFYKYTKSKKLENKEEWQSIYFSKIKINKFFMLADKTPDGVITKRKYEETMTTEDDSNEMFVLTQRIEELTKTTQELQKIDKKKN